jgi:glycosyltransferase involved in cell wall biosynthesis
LNAFSTHERSDILHSHSEFGDAALLMMKFRPRPPLILRTVHYGYRVEWRKRPLRRLLLTNFLYPLLLDREIGVSQAITDTLNQRRAARYFKKEAICLYNAIDLDRFTQVQVDRAGKRRSLNIPFDALLVGSAGRLAEQKGFSVLVDAAALVLEQLPEAYFLVMGEGELAAELKAQAHRLGIESRLIFSGPRSDVEEIFPCLDLFVSSSLWEGLPTVIIEAMAAGVPVVATDIPGTTELVENKINGLLAAKGDPQALARAIIEALQSKTMRSEFARRAFDTAQKFSIKTVAASYAALYRDLVKRDL